MSINGSLVYTAYRHGNVSGIESGARSKALSSQHRHVPTQCSPYDVRRILVLLEAADRT